MRASRVAYHKFGGVTLPALPAALKESISEATDAAMDAAIDRTIHTFSRAQKLRVDRFSNFRVKVSTTIGPMTIEIEEKD